MSFRSTDGPDPLRAPSVPPVRRPILRLASPTFGIPIGGYVVSHRPYPYWTHWIPSKGRNGGHEICVGPELGCPHCGHFERRWQAVLEILVGSPRGTRAIKLSAGAVDLCVSRAVIEDATSMRGLWCVYSRLRGAPQGALSVEFSRPTGRAPALPEPIDLAQFVRHLYGWAPGRGGVQ